MNLTERCSHLHTIKSRSVLLVHRFQIMESNTLCSPLVHIFFRTTMTMYFIIEKNIKPLLLGSNSNVLQKKFLVQEQNIIIKTRQTGAVDKYPFIQKRR